MTDTTTTTTTLYQCGWTSQGETVPIRWERQATFEEAQGMLMDEITARYESLKADLADGHPGPTDIETTFQLGGCWATLANLLPGEPWWGTADGLSFWMREEG